MLKVRLQFVGGDNGSRLGPEGIGTCHLGIPIVLACRPL